MSAQYILVLNAGSSSIKFAVYDEFNSEVAAGALDGIGGDAHLKIGGHATALDGVDHTEALIQILKALADLGLGLQNLSAVAHRVVHGGTKLTRSARITPEVRDIIAECVPLAPLHNPHNLMAIDVIAARAPDLPQFASFDTAFHATNPELAQRYAVPTAIDAIGIRRYGFHGTSYAALARRFEDMTGAALPSRVLAFHLGNGASVCALKHGQSVATTMGYSPISGITMGTRSGDIDANAVLRLADEKGMAETHKLLNHQSGLAGLSGGIADMRDLLENDSPSTQFAIDHFCYWAARHAGSLIMALAGLDAIIFTGGIGENAPDIRSRILAHFSWYKARLDQSANEANETRLHDASSDVSIWRIAADEERQILLDARALLSQSGNTR